MKKAPLKESGSPRSAEQKLHQQNGKVVENPWRALRSFTDARIGLGRAGISLPTSEMLAFQLAHAQARDAVNLPLDINTLGEQLSRFTAAKDSQPASGSHVRPAGCCAPCLPITLHSQAFDRTTYLQRPDLGRKLNEKSRQSLQDHMAQNGGQTQSKYDLAIVIADGLSSLAVQQNAVPFIHALIALLQSEPQLWHLAPITLVEQGRVAIGDDVGELLNAQVVLVLIGERPGLSSPDSLGLYLTWQPKIGLNDASRNCISNIRPAGLSYGEAAKRALFLLREARRLKLSGVNLKDRTQDDVIENQIHHKNFLLSGE
ncbi:MAG: ethanolamine ammonia-lyase small subunit [Paraglaciecola sp.]|jgi:ethanolamine ammonia-lyase small subunit